LRCNETLSPTARAAYHDRHAGGFNTLPVFNRHRVRGAYTEALRDQAALAARASITCCFISSGAKTLPDGHADQHSTTVEGRDSGLGR
jgi:hypothetical protein